MFVRAADATLSNKETVILIVELQLQKSKICGFQISYSLVRSCVAKKQILWAGKIETRDAAVQYGVKLTCDNMSDNEKTERLLGKMEGKRQSASMD